MDQLRQFNVDSAVRMVLPPKGNVSDVEPGSDEEFELELKLKNNLLATAGGMSYMNLTQLLQSPTQLKLLQEQVQVLLKQVQVVQDQAQVL